MTIIHHRDQETSATPSAIPSSSVTSSTILNADNVALDKLPLAIRKDVCDHWGRKQPQLECQLTALLGVPWRVVINVETLYLLVEDRYVKEHLGATFNEYISEAIHQIKLFLNEYGNYGKTAFNSQAFYHTVTIAQTDDPEIEYTDCEISGGCLVLLFSKGNLGINAYRAAEDLAGAVNKGVSCSQPGCISYLATHSINTNYKHKVEATEMRISGILSFPRIQLVPSFSENHVSLEIYVSDNYDFPRDWQKTFGTSTLQYFEGVADQLEELGFRGDDLLKDGFKEGVHQAQIIVRVVDDLVTGGDFNECLVRNGILYLQTTPRYWTADTEYTLKGLIEQL